MKKDSYVEAGPNSGNFAPRGHGTRMSMVLHLTKTWRDFNNAGAFLNCEKWLESVCSRFVSRTTKQRLFLLYWSHSSRCIIARESCKIAVVFAEILLSVVDADNVALAVVCWE